MPPGLAKKKHHWDGKYGTEKELYHPEALVLFQPKAWFDESCAVTYFKKVCPILEDHLDDWKEKHPDFPFEAKVLLQQDNLRGQNTLEIKKISFANDVFI